MLTRVAGLVAAFVATVSTSLALAISGASAAEPLGAEPRGWEIGSSDRPGDLPLADRVVDAHGAPGQLVTVDLQLTSRRASLDLTMTPRAVRTSEGVPELAEPRLTDAASWVSMPRARVADLPAGTAPLPVRISIPNTATAGERLAVVTVERRGTTERVDVLIRIRVDGPMRAGLRLSDSDLTYRRSGPWPLSRGEARWSMTATNDGTTILRGRLEVRLGTIFGQHIVADSRPDIVLAPGDSISLTSTTQAWPSVLLRPEIAIEQTVATPAGGEAGGQTIWEVADTARPLVVVPWAPMAWTAGAWTAATVVWVMLRRRSLQHVVKLP